MRHRRTAALAHRRNRRIILIDDLNRHLRDHRLAAQFYVGIRDPAPGRERTKRHALRDRVAIGRGLRLQRQMIDLAENSKPRGAGVDQDAVDGLAGSGAALTNGHRGERAVEVALIWPGPHGDCQPVGRNRGGRRHHRLPTGREAGRRARGEYRQRRDHHNGKSGGGRLDSITTHHRISDGSIPRGSIAGRNARPDMSRIWPAISTTTSLPRTDA